MPLAAPSYRVPKKRRVMSARTPRCAASSRRHIMRRDLKGHSSASRGWRKARRPTFGEGSVAGHHKMALFNVAAGLAGLAFAVGLFVVALVFALSAGYRTRRERPGGSRYGLTSFQCVL
jgi:hypothetical protein